MSAPMNNRCIVSARAGIRRIGIIKPSALGDVVQCLPVLWALRGRFRHAHIAWVINRNLADLLEGHAALDEVIPFQRASRGIRRVGHLAKLIGRLAAARFDLVCDLQCLLRTGLMALATGARYRIGLTSAREGAALFYTHVVPDTGLDVPAVPRYLRLAAALGADVRRPRFDLPSPPALQAWAAAQVSRLPRPILAIHPGARWETKRLPAAHFAALAARAQKEFGCGIALVGGPEERASADVIAAACTGRVADLVGCTSLPQLAAVLREVDVLVSGDSGPLHLAAALGTRVVGLFTCTDPYLSGPSGPSAPRHVVVATRVPCAASYLKQCDRLDCMAELTPGRVWPALARALGTAPAAA